MRTLSALLYCCHSRQQQADGLQSTSAVLFTVDNGLCTAMYIRQLLL